MTNTIRSSVSVHVLIGAGLVAMVLAIMSFPSFASAATYAFVDQSSNVRSIVADTWQTAIASAPNIHINSGVMLLNGLNNGILD